MSDISEVRNLKIKVYVTADEAAAIKSAARKVGMTNVGLLRSAPVREARRVHAEISDEVARLVLPSETGPI